MKSVISSQKLNIDHIIFFIWNPWSMWIVDIRAGPRVVNRPARPAYLEFELMSYGVAEIDGGNQIDNA